MSARATKDGRRPGGAPWDDYAWLLERARKARQWMHLVSAEARRPARLPLKHRLRGWAKGFGGLASLVYGLDRRDPSLFVSSYQQQVASLRINGAMDHVVNNKLLLPLLMRAVGLPTAAVRAFCRNGVWKEGSGKAIADFPSWLAAALPVGKKAVIKPAKGLKGKGLAFIERSTEGFTVNGRFVRAGDLGQGLFGRESLILVEFVEQADYARGLYPETSNSVRVLTVWDVDRGRPFVAAAAQRIGTRRSYPVDNWREGMGGLCAEVDLDTGRLGPAATVVERKRVAWFDRHPETDAPIAGTLVSGWTTVRDALARGAAGLPFAPLLGWDVLVTGDGFRVLELNAPPGLHVHQVHRPLLEDPRLRRFYASFGIGTKPGAAAGGGGGRDE